MVLKKTNAEGIKPKIRKESQKKISKKFEKAGVGEQERHHLIAEAAYFHAERRSFLPGAELEDWLAAEAEINRSLRKMHSSNSSHGS
jgi:hypothetical protein